jgi:3-deoxy-manno-octulosonate cytidylyltransferase (CMP-KDO synthetase)
MLDYLIVIPARLNSSRLPGKPLQDIDGQTMIERVVACARRSKASRIVVATDHAEIMRVLADKVETVMTNPEAKSGTDRIAEAIETLKIDDEKVIVNLQGDEPLMPSICLDQVAENLIQSQADMATLCSEFGLDEASNETASVKVVTSKSGRALYFSRALIPFDRDSKGFEAGDVMRHIGLYAYKASFIRQFVRWPVARIEELEQLEQLRAMHHDAMIHVDRARAPVLPGVDTQADLDRVRQHFQGDASNA